MAEFDPLELVVGGTDCTPAMQARRWLSGEGAGLPDQYDIAITQLVRHLGGQTLETLVDIGCNNGEFVLDGLRRVQDAAELAHPIIRSLTHNARLHETKTYGFDVFPEQVATHFVLNPDRPGFTYTQVEPPTIPMASASADGILALNVIFRTDAPELMQEIHRILKVGAVAVLSSNFKNHGWIRHHITNRCRVLSTMYQQEVQLEHGDLVTFTAPMHPPANSAYFPDLRGLVEAEGGLRVVGELVQDEKFHVTAANLDEYVLAMQLEASRTGLLPEFHAHYRDMVRRRAENFLLRMNGYFSDPIHRGTLALRKMPA